MAGVQFEGIAQGFRSGSFDSLGTIGIIMAIYVVVIAGIGIIAFCCKDKCWSLIFVILVFLSFIFTAAVGVLGFVTGVGNFFEEFS